MDWIELHWYLGNIGSLEHTIFIKWTINTFIVVPTVGLSPNIWILIMISSRNRMKSRIAISWKMRRKHHTTIKIKSIKIHKSIGQKTKKNLAIHWFKAFALNPKSDFFLLFCFLQEINNFEHEANMREIERLSDQHCLGLWYYEPLKIHTQASEE